jgi:hypothetical protein
MQTRRSFLKKGLVGGALLTLGGALGLFFRRSKHVPLPPGGLLVLQQREYWALDAIARRIIAPVPGYPTVDEVGVAERCDRILSRVDVTAQMELRQLLQLFENALPNFLLGGRPTPFSQLEPLEQDAVLNEWRTSSITLRRTGWVAIRSLVCAAYYVSPKAWPAMGYPGPPIAFHDANAPVWKGEGPRPPGNGVWVEPPAP